MIHPVRNSSGALTPAGIILKSNPVAEHRCNVSNGVNPGAEFNSTTGLILYGTPGMDENTIIEQLEEIIEKFGVKIRHEPIKQDEDTVYVVGGLCLLKGEFVLIINSNAAIRDKIRALGMALKQFDHEKIYMRPVLRELLEGIPEQKRFSMSGKHGMKVNDPL